MNVTNLPAIFCAFHWPFENPPSFPCLHNLCIAEHLITIWKPYCFITILQTNYRTRRQNWLVNTNYSPTKQVRQYAIVGGLSIGKFYNHLTVFTPYYRNILLCQLLQYLNIPCTNICPLKPCFIVNHYVLLKSVFGYKRTVSTLWCPKESSMINVACHLWHENHYNRKSYYFIHNLAEANCSLAQLVVMNSYLT